ncbi:MAG: phenylalanine--tRNA ligase subunit alpha, partial [Cellvibrionaceae bacterium]|nr:phenylalanine--tRNA ligase subunit alpha [Cellvibrionaceae bacterium]
MENLETLAQQAKAAVNAAADASALDAIRVEYLGKKGQLTGLLKGLGKLSPEERPKAGAQINVVKQEVQELINARKSDFEKATIDAQLASETVDVTLPGRASEVGGLHPVTR